MAETTSKRHRDATADTQTDPPKRHRNTYINNDQQENKNTTQELLDFFTNLPSSDPFLDSTQPEPESEPDPDTNWVIRHLLEASDDELGIPSRVDDGGDGGYGGDDVTVGGYDVTVELGLWELEDEAANYYTLLQSELFMQ